LQTTHWTVVLQAGQAEADEATRKALATFSETYWPPLYTFVRPLHAHHSSAVAASDLLQDVFGKEKNPSRLVYGVASLPLGTPVELELIFEVAG
jgi:hypothetical protein